MVKYIDRTTGQVKNMQLTESELRRHFEVSDIQKGKAYFRQGKVVDYDEHLTEAGIAISGIVRGTWDYEVHIELRDDGIRAECDCPRFADAHSCKHAVATLMTHIHRSRGAVETYTQKSDGAMLRLINAYMPSVNASPLIPHGEKARLIPRIETGFYHGEFPVISLKVGYDKLYVVRNIREFVERFEHQELYTYGKSLNLRHALSEFDEASQRLLRLILGEAQTYLHVMDELGVYRTNELKSGIALGGERFDRFFDLFLGQRVADAVQGDYLFCEANPQLTLRIGARGIHTVIEIEELADIHVFQSSRYLYAVQARRLMRCSQEFREQIYPLIQNGNAMMRISRGDLSAFCSCVLPRIKDFVTVEDSGKLLEQYLPDECTPCYYFDFAEEKLVCRLTYRYGTEEFDFRDKSGMVRHNTAVESMALQFLMQYFTLYASTIRFELRDTVDIYEFLVDYLPGFQQYGEVFVSDQLQAKQLRPVAANVGISVSDGMLTLDLDTGGFPAEELEELYHSMLLKKRYHRLKDGRYLVLEGSSVESIAEMAHMAQLPLEDLKNGSITMPSYRSLYIDAVLGQNEGLRVRRDEHYREMIRRFKTVEHSDYQIPAGFSGVLRPYQEIGYRWLKTLESCGFGGILADEMGLGKTLQLITFLSTVTQKQVGMPSLIVCPASLILNWWDEFLKFAPDMNVAMIMGTAAERELIMEQHGDCDVWVTSYDLLKRDIALYEGKEFYCCALDEGQFVKNQSTLASRAVKRIACRQRFVLTGTPIENRLSELWNLFDFLMPGYLFTHNRFVERLEKPIVRSQDAAAQNQLSKLVQPFMLRRLKSEVLKELPPKIEYTRRVVLEEDQQKLYYAGVNETRQKLAGSREKMQILAALMRLRQICCDPGLCFENYRGSSAKRKACLELVQSMTENGHQILLFSQFTSMLDILREELDKAEITSFTLQGSTTKEKRAQLVRDFNAGKAQVFLISLKAGGTGLNLTAADVVIHYDPWWNLAAQNQATDRAHRIGQQSCVQVYKLIAKDTIEERIMELQTKKAELMETVAGDTGDGILSMSQEELLALLD